MATVLTQISNPREVNDFVSDASIEAAIAEQTELVDQHLGEIGVEITAVRDQAAEVSSGDQAAVGISILTDSMLATHAVDENAAKTYSAALEALLVTAGIDIPVDMFVPSFESGSQFSFEAEEKKDNVLTRIFKWLAEAFNKFVEMVRSFFSRIWTSIPALRKLATALKIKVSKVSGSPKKGGDIPFGGQAQYLMDESGIIHKPEVIAGKAMEDYRKFLQDWQRQWAGFTNVKVPNIYSEQIQDFALHVNAVISNFGLNEKKTFPFLPTYAVSLAPGSDKKHPTTGMRVKVEKKPVNLKSGAVTPSPDELRKGVDAVLAALDTLEKTKKIIDDLTKVCSENAAKLANFKIGAKVEDEEVKELVKTINKQIPAYRVGMVGMAVGYTDTMPHYLQTVRAVLKYINAGAKRYASGTESVAEKQRYDANDVADGANTYEHQA